MRERTRMRVSVSLAMALVLGCQSEESSTRNECFAIYTLSDSTVSVSVAHKTPLEQLELSPEPLLSMQEIQKYDWSEHTVYVTPAALARVRGRGQQAGTEPFVVVAGKERVYLGGFWAPFSALGRFLPHIEAFGGPEGAIQIRAAWPVAGDAQDARSDERIYECLRQAGLLTVEQGQPN